MTAKDLLEGKRILLVDDEPDVLDTLADLLPTLIPLRRQVSKLPGTIWKPSISIWRFWTSWGSKGTGCWTLPTNEGLHR